MMNEIELSLGENGHTYIFRFDDESLLELAEVCQQWTETSGLETWEAVDVIEAAEAAIAKHSVSEALAWRRGRNLEGLKR